MKKPNILLIYKRSALSMAGKISGRLHNSRKFLDNHLAHYEALRSIEKILKKYDVPYKKYARGAFEDYSPYDVIVTVGGDGTVLHAARWVNRRQIILGVNSDPSWSVGEFCCTDAARFELKLKNLLCHKLKTCRLYKLQIRLKDGHRTRRAECLNDILICHANPGAMSRYALTIGGIKEDQRDSGIWFSTAAGSTGAMLSAGGKAMPISSTDFQYHPRELYQVKGVPYRLPGGFVKRPRKAVLVSFMPHGRVFVDGAHIKFPFTYGSRAEISLSSNFVQLVHD